MNVAEKFGSVVKLAQEKKGPRFARGVLRAGWQVQDCLFAKHPHKESFPADQYLAKIMMDAMLAPLKTPDCCIVSIFMPCELLQECGLSPYNAEAFSCYLSATFVEDPCIACAQASGISDTLCSYHRTFIGAAQSGLMPRPRCIVYTNLTCDANLLTFPLLAEIYDVPSFMIEVPREVSDSAVAEVAEQLRDMKKFLESVTGTQISEASLSRRILRSKRTLSLFEEYQKKRRGFYVPADLVTPLYSAMTANILLGTETEETYVRKCLEDLENAPPKKGKHIYWMHTIPFWSDAVKNYFLFKEGAQIVGDEISQVCTGDFPTDDPYAAMAYRMVHNAMNGPAERRIQAGIRHATDCGADGVVWFNHWGCKHTQGLSLTAKQEFEAAGFPFLALDGDGCDRSHGGEGQTLTRLGAFLEMLDQREGAGV